MNDNLTISEKIILLKENINQLISDSQMSVDIIMYVLKDCMNDLQNVFEQYQTQVYDSLNKKLQQQQKQDNSDEDK